MAMNRDIANRLTWLLPFALGAVFIGERIVGGGGVLRYLLTGGGVALVVAAVGTRGATWASAGGDRRRVEGMLLLACVGVLIALGLLFAPALADPGPDAGRTWTIMRVLSPILLMVSLVPMLMIQWVLGAGADGDASLAEAQRVREMAAAGLDIALAAAFLFICVYVASERNKKVDFSYFKTTEPGSATVNMVKTMDEPLEVLLFFPEVNEVRTEVRDYFEWLADKTGNVQIRDIDRMVETKLAKEHRVTRDGTVLMLSGKQTGKFTIDTDIKRARAKLRDFDTEVQKGLMKVLRNARTAYLVIGHDELNAPIEQERGPKDPFSQVSGIRDLLSLMNYRVKDLGLRQGLAQDVPDDATLLLIIGPKKPLLPEELASIDRFLQRGGSLLLGLEADTEVKLGPLAARLGVQFTPTPLADDKQFVPRRRTLADHHNIVTDQFSSHASVTTLARARVGSGILFMEAGALTDAEWAADYGEVKPQRTYVVRSLESTFADVTGNDTFDADGGEERKSRNLIATIEGKAVAAPVSELADGQAAPKMRAVVIADAQVMSDGILSNVQLNRGLVMDIIKWLGGDEKFTGEIKSEKDVPIKHTKEDDVAWFWMTIAGMPLLVLFLGLLGVWLRKSSLRRGGAA